MKFKVLEISTILYTSKTVKANSYIFRLIAFFGYMEKNYRNMLDQSFSFSEESYIGYHGTWFGFF